MLSTILRLLAAFDQTLLIPFVGIGGVAIYFSAAYFLRGRRAQQVESVAKQLGVAFRREGSREDKELMTHSCFGSGLYNHVRNVLEPAPVDGVTMKIFDYSYSFKTGRNLDTATQTVVHLRSPVLQLPSFLVRPKSSLAKIGQFLGAPGIDLAEAPGFNSRFLLRGENETMVRHSFTPSVVRHFEQLPGISVGGGGDTLVVFRDRQRARPTDFPKRLDEARAIGLALSVSSSPSPAPV